MSRKVLKACHDKLILKPIEDGESMYGNIVVPDMGKEKPEMAEVVSVGPGRLSEYGVRIIPSVSKGDIVIVPKIGTIRMDFEGEEYYMIPDREVLAIVKTVNK